METLLIAGLVLLLVPVEFIVVGFVADLLRKKDNKRGNRWDR